MKVAVAGVGETPVGRLSGWDSVGLHVFGHNKTARALYSSLGFYPTNINMTLKL